jgi:hypothetical protein
MEVSEMNRIEVNEIVDRIVDRYQPPLTTEQLQQLFKEIAELREVAEEELPEGEEEESPVVETDI